MVESVSTSLDEKRESSVAAETRQPRSLARDRLEVVLVARRKGRPGVDSRSGCVPVPSGGSETSQTSLAIREGEAVSLVCRVGLES